MQNDTLFKKLMKKLASLAMATIATVTPLVSGCTDPDANVDPGTTPPGTESPLPGEGTWSGKMEDNPYFKTYSKILQDVLTSRYYNDVISYEQNKYYSVNKTNTSTSWTYYDTTKDNYCENIPYGFLENVGYDIDEIKKADNSAVVSEVYVLDDEPNNLYFKTAVLNKSSINYYDTYHLKYEITDQEKKDLNRLFDMHACGFNHFKAGLYQAPFFIQEISYQKEPQIVAHGYMEESTFNYFKNGNVKFEDLNASSTKIYYPDQKTNGTKLFPVYNNISHTFYEDNSLKKMIFNMAFSTINDQHRNNSANLLQNNIRLFNSINIGASDLKSNGHMIVNCDNNNVIDLFSLNMSLLLYKFDYNIDNSNAVAKTATAYTIHSAQLLDGKEKTSEMGSGYKHDDSWLYKEIIENEDAGSTI